MPGEFALIDRIRARATRRPDVVLGIGDDAAVLAVPPGQQLVVTSDTLVAGVHFPEETAPADLGWKALAVNLSDLAAMAATPAWCTLALTLPRVDEAWLRGFARGLLDLADEHDCELIGGDTTAGPLAIGITVMGEVPAGQALLRSGAQVGDDLWVSGFPGEARLALEAFRGSLHPGLSTEAFEVTRLAMERPDPRVALGVGLRGLATAAIDVSDGLLGDLGHVLRRSRVGVSLCLDELPVSPWLATRSPDERLDCILAGGDDYELLFTTPPAQRERVAQLGAELGLVLSRIGQIEAEPGLRLWRGASAVAEPGEGRQAVPNRWTSFDHFKGAA